ncbi:MAG: GMC family oxidoreductase N-terminal domain-containing protein [Rhizobiales bacterium]|nr:GMC family oxidoreductase N-terminal domain-containing protein [Hyphomicrobiales bacterium]
MSDYVVVGGGSAGCVLAARLSEDPAVTVTLLEAGPRDTNMYIHLPVGFFKMTAGPLIWGYETEPGREISGRKMVYPQARVLGGGSSINAQVFTRGCPEDYDAWRDADGCADWGYRDVLPYFRKSEGNDTFAGEHHGNDGPLGVSTTVPHPLTRVFVRAAQEAGLPFNADFNGGKQAGAGFYQATTRGGRRSSTAVGYLRPALRRPNLTVRTGVLVNRIVIEGDRAVGVEIIENGRPVTLRAEREVVVASGAIGSPKLLMLSGIGPADQLGALGIAVVRDAAAVGQNLQDHMDVDVLAQLSGSHGIDRYKKRRWQAVAGLEYVLFGKGPVASNIVEAGGFWWSDRSEATPDMQFHFLPGAGLEEGIGGVPGGHGCTLNSYHVRPRSRGSVTLRSADPRVAPAIDPNAFAEPYDLDRAVDGIEMSREILSQPAFRPFVSAIHLPGPGIRSRAELMAFAREHARSAYHPVGTCRMGGGEDSVVDPQLRVRGIGALRVCDSSIMPRLISSNTNAATVMIAEKAADLIKSAAAGHS